MRWIPEARERMRALLFRAREEAEMDEEMRFHLEMETEKNLREGMGPGEARRRALLAFGGVAQQREAVRDARGLGWAEDAWRDLRMTGRRLRKSPGFALTAVLTLALGIGATTAVFGLANWLLLRPIPGVVDPERVVHVEPRNGSDETGISYPNLVDLRAGTDALSHLAGTAPADLQVAAGSAEPRAVRGEAVVGDYFGLLGLRPLAGRLLLPAELEGGPGTPVAVISARLWGSLFGRDPGAVGRGIRMNGHAFTVVGVAPEGFRGPERTGKTDVWIPGSMYTAVRHDPPEDRIESRDIGFFMSMLGRLRPGATPEAAEAQLRAVMDRLVEEYPEANGIYREYRPTVIPGLGLPLSHRERVAGTARLMLALSALVLLIACANAANLLLLRGLRRRRESAVRRALGASAGRVLRQSAAEALLLSLLGCAGGFAVALGTYRGLRGLSLPGLVPIEDVSLDWRVLGFALAVALLATLLCAIAPALLAYRAQITDVLKGSASSGSTARGGAARSAILVLQLSLTLVLLVGALLLARTLQELRRVDLGFDAEGVLAFTVDPEPQGYAGERVREFGGALLREVSSRPGVAGAALVTDGPFSGVSAGMRLRLPGTPEDAPRVRADLGWISAGYFPLLRIPIVRGRDFRPEETGRTFEAGVVPAVLSAGLAERLFPGRDPLGQRLELREGETIEVVGVVGDVRSWDLRGGKDPLLYLPTGSAWWGRVTVLVRPRGAPAAAEAEVREALAAVDPSLPLYEVEPLAARVAEAMAEERLLSRLVGLLAALASVLSAVGLFAVVAHSVAERTREIGIRMALGASARRVVALAVRQGAAPALAGLALGIAGAAALARVLEARLFGVAPLEPGVYLAATAAFLLLAALAAALPARAATRVDPMVTLRHE